MSLDNLVSMIFGVVKLLIFVRIIMSFLPMDLHGNEIVRAIYNLTEPLMAPFRKLIPSVGMIDISPIILFLVLNLAERLIKELL